MTPIDEPKVGTATIYPTFGSLKEVEEYAESEMPIMTRNKLRKILAIHRNTIIKLTASH